MGTESIQLVRDHRELDDRPEPVGVSRGGLRGRRHRQAATKGGQALQQHRQVVEQDHDARPRDAERRAVLRRGRYADAVAAASSGTTGAVSEISYWVSIEGNGSYHILCNKRRHISVLWFHLSQNFLLCLNSTICVRNLSLAWIKSYLKQAAA